MDRFIAIILQMIQKKVLHLKSNMDRFIGHSYEVETNLDNEFKIQYG